MIGDIKKHQRKTLRQKQFVIHGSRYLHYNSFRKV